MSTNAHNQDTHSSVMQSVDEIRSAEAQAEFTIDEAKKNSQELTRKSKEAILKFSTETEKEVTNYKNDLLSKGSKKTEQQVEKVLEQAKKEAEKIKPLNFDKKAVLKATSEIIFSK